MLVTLFLYSPLLGSSGREGRLPSGPASNNLLLVESLRERRAGRDRLLVLLERGVLGILEEGLSNSSSVKKT